MAKESVQLERNYARLDLTWHLKRTEELVLVFTGVTDMEWYWRSDCF